MCCYLAESITKTVKTSYFGLVSPCSYKRPERSCRTRDNWIPQQNKLLGKWAVGPFYSGAQCHFSAVMVGFLYLRGLPHMHSIGQTWSAFHAAPLSPPPSPKKPSEWAHDNITHSEANVFTMHRHGSVQSIITTLRLQPSRFSNNAQMYQLLLLHNENRWETGDKPCL